LLPDIIGCPTEVSALGKHGATSRDSQRVAGPIIAENQD